MQTQYAVGEGGGPSNTPTNIHCSFGQIKRTHTRVCVIRHNNPDCDYLFPCIIVVLQNSTAINQPYSDYLPCIGHIVILITADHSRFKFITYVWLCFGIFNIFNWIWNVYISIYIGKTCQTSIHQYSLTTQNILINMWCLQIFPRM